MTITSTTTRAQFSGNGSTTSFPISFAFWDADDLTVTLAVTATGVETTWVRGTQYTVAGGSGSTGTLSVVTSPTDYTPASGYTLTIESDLDYTQPTAFPAGGSFPSTSVERQLDQTVRQIQQIAKLLARSLRQPISDAADMDDLPVKATRASKYLAFDADGDPIASDGTGTTSPISTFGATVVDDTSAGAMLTTLGVSAFVQTLLDDVSAAAFLGTLGFTAFARTINDDADGAAVLATLVASATAATARQTLHASLRGHLAGLTLSNNGSDATNDIDIAVGECADSTAAALLKLSSALTKRLDAAWAVGTNQGGLDTGAIANGTYHVWLIRRSDTGVVDALFSTSASSPTMPANYDQKRRIGSILRESAAIVAFTQDADLFTRSATVLDINATNPGTSAVTRTLSVPIGIRVGARVAAGGTETTGNVFGRLTDLSATDEACSSNNSSFAAISNGSFADAHVEMEVLTNTSAQIRSRMGLSSANTGLTIRTIGWRDTRGRFD